MKRRVCRVVPMAELKALREKYGGHIEWAYEEGLAYYDMGGRYYAAKTNETTEENDHA